MVLVTDKPLQHGRRRRGHGLHADDVSGFVQRVEQHNANWRVVPMPLSLEIDILTSLNNKQRKQLDSLISLYFLIIIVLFLIPQNIFFKK